MNKIRKGDEVIVIAGRDKGKRGKVVLRKDDEHLVVEGINLVKKHTKPNPQAARPASNQAVDTPRLRRPAERSRNSNNRNSRVVSSISRPPRCAWRETVSSLRSASRRTVALLSIPRRVNARTRAASSASANGFGK